MLYIAFIIFYIFNKLNTYYFEYLEKLLFIKYLISDWYLDWYIFINIYWRRICFCVFFIDPKDIGKGWGDDKIVYLISLYKNGKYV